MLNAECRMPNGEWFDIPDLALFGVRHSAFGIRHSAFGIRN
jgi:hypothetical protein